MTEPFFVAIIMFLYIEGCGPQGIGFKLSEAQVFDDASDASQVWPPLTQGAEPCWSFSLAGGYAITVPAVEHAVKPGAAPARPEPAGSESPQLAPRVERTAMAPPEDASRYCPVCSRRLESRRCKLVCAVCGYYMSCADYY